MARLMLSPGIFSALAAAMAVRSRGLPSGSPPDLAAIVISLISWVKTFPRLASAAPFLCLIVAHFEWPDMKTSAAFPGCWERFARGRQEAEIALHQAPQPLSVTR